MTTHVSGQHGITSAVAPTLHVGTYRRALLAVIIGCPLFSDAEQVLANHNAHACQDAQRLSLWTRNVLRERDRREAADLAKAEQAAAVPTGNLLADLQNPAYVAQHGDKQAAPGFKTLTVADAYKAAVSLRQAFASAQQPSAPAATAEQCSELHQLALHPLTLPAERAQILLGLPCFTSEQAATTITTQRANLARRSGAVVPVQVVAPAQPAAPAPPAWLTTRGRITRAQRQELERRLLPQQATSHTARLILEIMGGWSAARATAELLRASYDLVPHAVKRELRFSVGGTMAPGLLPRRAYAAFKRLRRVVSPCHTDMQFAQPGEGYDFCLAQN